MKGAHRAARCRRCEPKRVGITSVKGVLFDDAGRVLLCHNERGEWELPGGRPERHEDDEACLQREIREETGLTVEVAALVSAYRFEVLPGQEVDIRAYGCWMSGPALSPVLSDEHIELGFFSPATVETINLPDGYRSAIALWRVRKRTRAP
jgi:8-oxo-dGTP pyrophosphatase MutT (NUDIX family)